jgi:hypothetical protein
MDQVHLTQIGLGRIPHDARAVLHRLAPMRIALDAEPGEQPDEFSHGLAHRVLRAACDRNDLGCHLPSSRQ